MEFVNGPPAWREWNGQRWYYSTRLGRYRSATGLPLAQAVWCWHNGPVPEGYEVHHRNENPADDRLENLELRERHEHRSHHAPSNGKKGSLVAGNVGALALWAKREPDERVCEHCGATYFSRSTYSSYCGPNCRAGARRRRERERFRVQ